MTLSDSDIARRAFELYCARGYQDGHDVEDWLQAERELRQAATAPPVRARRAPRPRRRPVTSTACRSPEFHRALIRPNRGAKIFR